MITQKKFLERFLYAVHRRHLLRTHLIDIVAAVNIENHAVVIDIGVQIEDRDIIEGLFLQRFIKY